MAVGELYKLYITINPITMKTYLKPLVTLLIFLSTLCMACENEDEDEAVTPDPRAAIVGDYEMDDYQIHIYDDAGVVDTTITVVSKPVITFKADQNINVDELRIDLREFIEETVTIYFNPNLTKVIEIKNPDAMIAEKVTAREFEIKDVYYDLIFSDGVQTWIYPFDFNAKGKLDKGNITLQFVTTNYSGGERSTIDGTATGEKDR